MDLRQLGNRTSSSLTVRQNVSYIQAWEIEKRFDVDFWTVWSTENLHWSVYISLAYLVTIFGLQAWMKGRKRFVLRKPLFLWNCCLAMFSIVAVLRVGPEILHVLSQEWNGTGGWLSPFCSRIDTCQTSAFWGFMFMASKVVELGDTLFIVLRKQPLIFLHWYHHVTVLISTWYVGRFLENISRFGGFMNFTVHSFMYTYYAVKSIYSGIPRIIAMFITLLQLSQMVLGVAIALYSFFNSKECLVSPKTLQVAFWIYASYFVLFANYFFKSYGLSVSRRKDKAD